MGFFAKFFTTSLVCCILGGCVTDGEDDFYEIGVGETLPAFSIKMSMGETVNSRDLKNHVSVIVFFNTGCPDCREELSIVQRVYNYCIEEEIKVRFLCISRNEGDTSVARYWQKHNITLPYSAQTDRTVYSLFASSIIPRIYIVSPSLVITHSFTDNPLVSYEALVEAINFSQRML